jgi:hypothetical protein
MPFAAVITLPKTSGNKTKLENFLQFLRDSTSVKGEYKLLWECPFSKQFIGIRAEKHNDDKFPMSLEIIAPKILYLPFFSHSLTPDDVRELISVCKLELDTKWDSVEGTTKKQVTFSS